MALPIESTLPTLCTVRRNGMARITLYKFNPCMTEPPGVESNKHTCAMPWLAQLDSTASSDSVVCGTISAEKLMYMPGGGVASGKTAVIGRSLQPHVIPVTDNGSAREITRTAPGTNSAGGRCC